MYRCIEPPNQRPDPLTGLHIYFNQFDSIMTVRIFFFSLLIKNNLPLAPFRNSTTNSSTCSSLG